MSSVEWKPCYKSPMNRSDSWLVNIEELKVYVAATSNFPSKQTRLNNWWRYQRKRAMARIMPQEQKRLFEAVTDARDDIKKALIK